MFPDSLAKTTTVWLLRLSFDLAKAMLMIKGTNKKTGKNTIQIKKTFDFLFFNFLDIGIFEKGSHKGKIVLGVICYLTKSRKSSFKDLKIVDKNYCQVLACIT